MPSRHYIVAAAMPAGGPSDEDGRCGEGVVPTSGGGPTVAAADAEVTTEEAAPLATGGKEAISVASSSKPLGRGELGAAYPAADGLVRGDGRSAPGAGTGWSADVGGTRVAESEMARGVCDCAATTADIGTGTVCICMGTERALGSMAAVSAAVVGGAR